MSGHFHGVDGGVRGAVKRIAADTRRVLGNRGRMLVFNNRRIRAGHFSGIDGQVHLRKVGVISTSSVSSPVVRLVTSLTLTFILCTTDFPDIVSDLATNAVAIIFSSVVTLVHPLGSLAGIGTRFRHNVTTYRALFAVLSDRRRGSRNGHIVRHTANSIRFHGIAFACPKHSMPTLHGVGLGVPTKGAITLIKHSNSNGSAVTDLVAHFCSVSRNRVLVSNRSLHRCALTSLHGRITLISRGIRLFGSAITGGVTCTQARRCDHRRVRRTTHVTCTVSFVGGVSGNLSAIVNRGNILLSNNRHRHVTVTQTLLHSDPVLVLSRTASTLSARSRHTVRTTLSRLRGGHASLIVTRHLSAVRGTSRVIIIRSNIVIRHNARGSLLRRHNICTRLRGVRFNR